MSVSIARAIGDEGKMYGSVTTKDIEDAFTAAGVKLDRKKIVLTDALAIARPRPKCRSSRYRERDRDAQSGNVNEAVVRVGVRSPNRYDGERHGSSEQ